MVVQLGKFAKNYWEQVKSCKVSDFIACKLYLNTIFKSFLGGSDGSLPAKQETRFDPWVCLNFICGLQYLPVPEVCGGAGPCAFRIWGELAMEETARPGVPPPSSHPPTPSSPISSYSPKDPFPTSFLCPFSPPIYPFLPSLLTNTGIL